MRLLADENIARQIVARLRSDGHDVLYVKEGAQGSADVDVLATAVRESAVLLTDDQDFGDLVMFQRRSALGVILVRLEGVAPDERAQTVSDVIRRHAAELAGSFTVIKRSAVRIRKLPS